MQLTIGSVCFVTDCYQEYLRLQMHIITISSNGRECIIRDVLLRCTLSFLVALPVCGKLQVVEHNEHVAAGCRCAELYVCHMINTAGLEARTICHVQAALVFVVRLVLHCMGHTLPCYVAKPLIQECPMRCCSHADIATADADSTCRSTHRQTFGSHAAP